MGRPVVHFEVIGKDDERLRSFYGELFEWQMNADNPMRYGIVDRDLLYAQDLEAVAVREGRRVPALDLPGISVVAGLEVIGM